MRSNRCNSIWMLCSISSSRGAMIPWPGKRPDRHCKTFLGSMLLAQPNFVCAFCILSEVKLRIPGKKPQSSSKQYEHNVLVTKRLDWHEHLSMPAIACYTECLCRNSDCECEECEPWNEAEQPMLACTDLPVPVSSPPT